MTRSNVFILKRKIKFENLLYRPSPALSLRSAIGREAKGGEVLEKSNTASPAF